MNDEIQKQIEGEIRKAYSGILQEEIIEATIKCWNEIVSIVWKEAEKEGFSKGYEEGEKFANIIDNAMPQLDKMQKTIEEHTKELIDRLRIYGHKACPVCGINPKYLRDFLLELLTHVTHAEKRGEEKATKEIAHKLEDESWTMNGHTVVCMSDVWNIARRQSQEREEK